VSNFSNHNFLDTNQHEVKRSFERMLEKYRLHNQDKEVDDIEKLLKLFMERKFPRS
jgi:hypothetical protein